LRRDKTIFCCIRIENTFKTVYFYKLCLTQKGRSTAKLCIEL